MGGARAVIGLLIPFLIADAILGWMLVTTWRRQEVWLVTRMGRKDENRRLWWMSVVRLAALLALSMTGTLALLLA
ncbi:hypothetical protein CKY28_12165 [Sphingomonas lenta]|uniref:Uncharacterized protein n=1 Tax=Sphingomonas lenta TaxID=1141887 RepID=A0A2A2SCV0_9SPHN|nr:hypothetical protein CKY28_12165 [Sphingomonas lenta]